MTRIGLISDTHGYIEPKIFEFFKSVDEIWHAGDMGTIDIPERLKKFKPLRGVYGNVDGQEIRYLYPENLRFKCEETDVWITHIGGYPGKYDTKVKKELEQNSPDIFISGHSHILKVQYDEKLDLLHINPGALGNSGFHQVKTAVRFNIDGNNIKDLKILDIKRR
ncbi:MAG: metallophosphoesterase family protein [Bacteroidota bacterium]